MIKLINNYWVDKNNNKWECSSFTKSEAKYLLKTLNKCKNCTNCTECNECNACNGCKNCNNCNTCTDCYKCNECNNCIECENCYKNENCKYDRFCNYCSNGDACLMCIECTDCTDCKYCTSCYRCTSCLCCLGCTLCTKCNYWTNISTIKGDSPRYITKNIFGTTDSATFYIKNKKIYIMFREFNGRLNKFESDINMSGLSYTDIREEINKAKILFSNYE